MKNALSIKKYLVFTLAMFLLVPSMALANNKKLDPTIPSDAEIMGKQDSSVIITVNGVEIPKWMYDNGLRDGLKKAEKNPDIDQNTIKKEVLTNLIDMEALYQEAKKEGIAINEAGGHLRSSIVGARYKKPGEFKRVLAAAGMTEKQYSAIWQQQAAVNELLNVNILDKVKVTEEELKARYEKDKNTFERMPKIRASHILIKLDKDVTAEAKKVALDKITDIHKQALEGKDFAELAKQYTEEPNAQIGGDLGFFSRQEMVKPFATAAFALKTGEISGVVETKFGYHIIKKTDEQDAIPSLDEVRTRLASTIRNEKGREAFNTFKAELVKNAKIEIKDPELEAIYDAR